jgi:hypothetical protein
MDVSTLPGEHLLAIKRHDSHAVEGLTVTEQEQA